MAAAAAAVCFLAVAAGAATERTPDSFVRRCGPSWVGGPPFFSSTAPFNRPIPFSAAVDPRSPEMVAGLVAAGTEGRFSLSVKSYTIPVYYVGPDASTRDVPLTASWAPWKVLRAVPIPPNVQPSPGSDGHVTIVDKRAGCEYDFWGTTRLPGGGLTAKWGNVISLSRSGVFTNGPAARASGFALLAGLILPAELRQGHIDHALVFGYPFTRAGGPVPPAIGSDGLTQSAQAIPEGARVQLDPSLDLATLGLRTYELIVARALQEFGAYISDTGGAVSFPVAHPHSWAQNPYTGLLPDDTYVSLAGIPLDRLRVLKLPR